jgi:hypothetical protein
MGIGKVYLFFIDEYEEIRILYAILMQFNVFRTA